jgi:iron complex outermembrane receptor protein
MEMLTSVTKRAALAATAMSGILTTPAFAQDEPSADAGDIIVTARRVEEKLQDVPISITVFNQEQITSRNIVNAADLGIYTPSLSTNSRFGVEKASFVIRGFVQDSPTQPSVGVYFADVVGPRAAGSTPSGNGVGVGNLFDLQNVQVLKGPQGTLFGRNTTGGAVLLVPRKPTDELEGYVEGSLGNYDMRRGQAVINVPLADTFKVRLGVDRMKRDGYLINHSGIGPDRLADSDFVAARLSVVADLTPDLENYTIGSYLKSNNHGVVARIVGCNPASTAFFGLCSAQLARASTRGWWDVENNEPNAKLKNETWQVINTTTWRASDTLTIKNIISYAEFRETSRYNLNGENYTNPATGAPVLTAIRTNNTPGYYLSSQSTMTEELQFQGGSADGKLTWQAGGYFENSDPIGFTSQMTPLVTNCQDAYDQLKAGQLAADSIHCPSGTVSIPFQKTYFRNRGLYAQATYDLTDQLSLTGGVRYTWDKMTHRYDGTSISFPTPTTNLYTCSNSVRLANADGTAPVVIGSLGEHDRCKVVFTAKSDRPTWLIDLDYKPTPDVLIYAKWARGFRAGGVAAANILFETWQPEKVDTYEVGAKTSFRGSSVRGYFNVAGFYNDFSNQQIQAGLQRNPRPGNPAPGAAVIVNAGKSRIYGAEVDASATFFDDLKLDVGYTYLNTKVKEIVVPSLPAAVLPFYSAITPNTRAGLPLALSPKHRVSVTGTYTLPIDDSIGEISLGATLVHTSKQFLTIAVPAQFGNIKATNLVLLNASWKNIMRMPVDLSFFMTNATNEKYPLATTTAYNSFGGETQLPNEPRMWGFRLKYYFGQ